MKRGLSESGRNGACLETIRMMWQESLEKERNVGRMR